MNYKIDLIEFSELLLKCKENSKHNRFIFYLSYENKSELTNIVIDNIKHLCKETFPSTALISLVTDINKEQAKEIHRTVMGVTTNNTEAPIFLFKEASQACDFTNISCHGNPRQMLYFSDVILHISNIHAHNNLTGDDNVENIYFDIKCTKSRFFDTDTFTE